MAIEDAEPESELPGARVLDTIADSTSLKVVILGLLFWAVATGMELLPVPADLETGVWAAILAVWGTALIIVGSVIYVFFWWSYR